MSRVVRVPDELAVALERLRNYPKPTEFSGMGLGGSEERPSSLFRTRRRENEKTRNSSRVPTTTGRFREGPNGVGGGIQCILQYRRHHHRHRPRDGGATISSGSSAYTIQRSPDDDFAQCRVCK